MYFWNENKDKEGKPIDMTYTIEFLRNKMRFLDSADLTEILKTEDKKDPNKVTYKFTLKPSTSKILYGYQYEEGKLNPTTGKLEKPFCFSFKQKK